MMQELERHLEERDKRQRAIFNFINNAVTTGFFLGCLYGTKSRMEGIQRLKEGYRNSYNSFGFEGTAKGMKITAFDEDGGKFTELVSYHELYDLICCALFNGGSAT